MTGLDQFVDMWAGKAIRYFGQLQLPKSRVKTRVKNGVPPASGRVIWFSWPAYGKTITQKKLEQELPHLQATGIDTVILDDGWELLWGDWQPQLKKFPDLKKLAQQIKQHHLKPGIWVAPFCVSSYSKTAKTHPEWLKHDQAGRPIRWQKFWRLPPDPLTLDLHQKKVRRYLITQLIKLGKLGFELFKLDYLIYAFLPHDQKNTRVYRQFFSELRAAFLAKKLPLEILGCGGPIKESLGLFELMRFTLDSSLQYFGWFVNQLVSGLNNWLYRDGFEVALKRVPHLGSAYGLTFDGLHLFDHHIFIDEKLKKSVAKKILKISKKIKSVNLNLTVGDSLLRSEMYRKNQWKKYLKKFKKIIAQ